MEPQEVFSLAFVVVCCDFSKPKQYISPKLQGSSLLYINLSTRAMLPITYEEHIQMFLLMLIGEGIYMCVVLLWCYMVSVGAFLM